MFDGNLQVKHYIKNIFEDGGFFYILSPSLPHPLSRQAITIRRCVSVTRRRKFPDSLIIHCALMRTIYPFKS
jgi:hypothetical protein